MNLKLNKRSFIAIVLCFMLLLTSGFILSVTKANAQASDTNSDLSFSLYNNNEEYRVSALNKLLVEADIPEKYNGLPVTSIADNGFANCKQLQSVRIPSSIKTIGTNAFSACSSLVRVVGMTGVKNIRNSAFANCTALTNLVLPNPNLLDSCGTMILRNVPNAVYLRGEESVAKLNWETTKILFQKE